MTWIKWIVRIMLWSVAAVLALGLLIPVVLMFLFSPPQWLLALKPRYVTAPSHPPVFEGASTQLKASQILATLEEPIPAGKNVIWCASFVGAWKELQNTVVKGPVLLQGDPSLAAALNRADDPRSQISAKEFYAVAGWRQHGIVAQIEKDLAQKFPGKPMPDFSGGTGDELIAYSYLEANVPFTFPYFQNRKPLQFTDSTGRQTAIRSFGIRREDEYGQLALRKQVRILFVKYRSEEDRHSVESENSKEFAVDLCTVSSPNQIVLARVNPEPTLAATLAKVNRLEKEQATEDNWSHRLGPADVLFVPDFYWKISHRFTGLEGRNVISKNLKGMSLSVAREDLVFRLDRNGAELRADVQMRVFAGPSYFVFDRPFLLYIKKRDAQTPFFVMWVDNAELLTPWR